MKRSVLLSEWCHFSKTLLFQVAMVSVIMVMALCAVETVAAFQPQITGFSSAMRLRGSEVAAKRPAVLVMNAGIRPEHPVPRRGSFRSPSTETKETY